MLLERIKLSSAAMERVRRVSCLLPLTLPLTFFYSAHLAEKTGLYDLLAWVPILLIFGPFTALDYLVGKDLSNPSRGGKPSDKDEDRSLWFKSMPLMSAAIYFVTLAWAIYVLTLFPFSPVGVVGWIFSIGSISGMLAINVAHELIHKTTRLEQTIGGALLSCVCYGSFKVEHTLGHHAWVATRNDGSSAQRGDNVYAFMLRALWHNPRTAHRLQVARMQRINRPYFSLSNELLWWFSLSVALAAAAFAFAGLIGLLFFLGQSLVAILHLECINYIEHYGLNRQQDENGRLERVTPMHSWNSSYFLTNAYLFQLQRHSDHHANALRPYEALQTHDKAPELPGGYGAMMMLALVPPLWRKVIHPRLPA